MHPAAWEFVKQNACVGYSSTDPVRILDIGGRNVNGTVRDLFPKAEYVSVDLRDGPGVDVVADIMDYLPEDRVDMVVCCEVLEHAPRWREIVQRCCRFLRPGGKLIVTCAGPDRIPHSAVDGRHELLPGEYYANISLTALSDAAINSGFQIETQGTSPNSLEDTYLIAVWPGFRVIPAALPEHMVNAVKQHWPADSWSGWHRYAGDTGDKYGLKHADLLPAACRHALDRLMDVAGSMLPSGCFWDYDLHGAGLHMLKSGGFLGRHQDAERHPLQSWRRSHSLVCFLESCDGGELVIDDKNIVSPDPGVAVLFETHKLWHAVNPVRSHRRTLALFAWEHVDQFDSSGSICSTFSMIENS